MPWSTFRYVIGSLLVIYSLYTIGEILYKVLWKKGRIYFRLRNASLKRLFTTGEDIFWVTLAIAILLLGLGLTLLDFFGLVPLAILK